MHFTDGQIERMHSVLPQYRPDVFNTGWECTGDLNGDAAVGTPDLLIVMSLWNTEYYGPADINGDGWVTLYDLMEVLNNYGALCLGADLDPFYQEEQLPVIKTEGMPRR